LNNLREVITGYLAKSEGQENDFYQLYIIRELRELGIDITAWPPSKAFYHDIMRVTVSTTPVLNRFFRNMDDFFGYGIKGDPETFWELDLPPFGWD
jgi:hypothetical protein